MDPYSGLGFREGLGFRVVPHITHSSNSSHCLFHSFYTLDTLVASMFFSIPSFPASQTPVNYTDGRLAGTS